MLPQLPPMLAVAWAPFDGAQYCFEIKGDGMRALAAVEHSGWRLWGRDGAEYTSRYAELEVVRRWPPGTLVDGELVCLRGGLPNLAGLLQRHFLAAAWKVAQARQWCPVHYVVFDLLYLRGRCLLREPLACRRDLLAELCAETVVPGLLWSAGVVGAGRAFYEAVVAAGHEGVLAKALTAPYRPGRRAPTWRKIKPRRNGAGRRPRSTR
jgi:bifunctional non-homologous end joining protein LigD